MTQDHRRPQGDGDADVDDAVDDDLLVADAAAITASKTSQSTVSATISQSGTNQMPKDDSGEAVGDGPEMSDRPGSVVGSSLASIGTTTPVSTAQTSTAPQRSQAGSAASWVNEISRAPTRTKRPAATSGHKRAGCGRQQRQP